MINKYIKKAFYLIVIIACIVFCAYPILDISKFLYGHDISFHSARVFFAQNALEHFKIPTYISCFDTLAYADQVMYPSLFIYIPAIINMFTKNIYMSINIFSIMIIVLGFLISYISAKIISKSTFVSIVFTIIYNVSFYYLFNIYDRYALGEVISAIFIPLFIAGLYNIYFEDNKNIMIYVLGLTAIMQSHVITTFYLSIFLLIFATFFIRLTLSKKVFVELIKANVLFLLLNLWFIVPFVDYYLNGNIHFSYPNAFSVTYVAHFENLFAITNETRYLAKTSNHFGIESIIFYFINLSVLIGLKRYKEKEGFNNNEYNLSLLSFIAFNIYFIFTFHNIILDSLLNIDIFNKLYFIQQFSQRIIGRSYVFLCISFALSMKIFSEFFNKKIKIIFRLVIVILLITITFTCNKNYINDAKIRADYPDLTLEPLSMVIYDDYKLHFENGEGSEYKNITTTKNESYKKIKTNTDNIIIGNYKRDYLDIDFEYEVKDFDYDKDYFVDLPFYNYRYFTVRNNNNDVINTYYGNDQNNVRIKLISDEDKLSLRFEPPLSWIFTKYILILTLLFLFRKKIIIAFNAIYRFIKNNITKIKFYKIKEKVVFIKNKIVDFAINLKDKIKNLIIK